MGVYLISIIIRAQCLENGIRDDLFVVPSKTKREVGANALKVELLHCRFDIGINKTVEVFEHSNLIGVNVVSEEVFKQGRMEHLLTLLKKVVAIFGDESNFIFDAYLKNGFPDQHIAGSFLPISRKWLFSGEPFCNRLFMFSRTIRLYSFTGPSNGI